MAQLTPPQAPPTWKHTAQDIDKLITEALEKRKNVNDAIVKLPEHELSFDNVSTVFHPSPGPISQPLFQFQVFVSLHGYTLSGSAS